MNKKELQPYIDTIKHCLPELGKFAWKVSSAEESGNTRYLHLRDYNEFIRVSIAGVYMSCVYVYPNSISLSLDNHMALLKKEGDKVKIDFVDFNDKEVVEIVERKDVHNILRKYN